MKNAQEVIMATITKKPCWWWRDRGGERLGDAQVLHRRIVAVPRAPHLRAAVLRSFWPPYYSPGTTRTVSVDWRTTRPGDAKKTEVYVDGYYAAMVPPLRRATAHDPGRHAVTLHLDGYRTVTENIYVRPDRRSR